MLFTTVSAGVLVAWTSQVSSLPDWPQVVLFLILVFLADSFSVQLHRVGVVSVSFTILCAAWLLEGPFFATLISLGNAFTFVDLKRRTPWWKVIFNGSQYAIAAGLSSLAYVYLGGTVGGLRAEDFPTVLVPLASSAALFWAFNWGLVAVAIGLAEKRPPWRVWVENFGWTWPNFLLLAVIGVVLAEIYVISGPIGLILLIAPLAVARHTFQIYLKLRTAFVDTIQTMMTVLEAKDKYTRGHSERVRKYSRLIGEQMRLSEREMEILDYAAVLHDVGKVGIPRAILNKPDKLSNEEFAVVRRHPQMGAHIVQQVKFLQPAVPALFNHHERMDGTGYAASPPGEVPLLARILAVADTYDAMTSRRPYRPPLPRQVAAEELIRHCGTQFDPAVVRAFLRAINLEQEADRVPHAPQAEAS